MEFAVAIVVAVEASCVEMAFVVVADVSVGIVEGQHQRGLEIFQLVHYVVRLNHHPHYHHHHP